MCVCLHNNPPIDKCILEVHEQFCGSLEWAILASFIPYYKVLRKFSLTFNVQFLTLFKTR